MIFHYTAKLWGKRPYLSIPKVNYYVWPKFLRSIYNKFIIGAIGVKALRRRKLANNLSMVSSLPIIIIRFQKYRYRKSKI